jgi:hypothetical protein
MNATKIFAVGMISIFALLAILAASTLTPVFAAASNSFPTAKDVTAHVRHDHESSGNWLRGNHDPDSHYVITSQASHGYVNEFNGVTGSVTYTPDPGFRGTDSFTYLIRANGWPQTESNTAIVTIVIK